MKNDRDTINAAEHRTTYPIRCIECGKIEVRPALVTQSFPRNHDGRVYALTIRDMPVTRCSACGEVYFTSESDDHITAALREHLALLTPEQIRDNLQALQLTQKKAATILGIAPETLSRWLTGAIVQSRAMDNYLRAFFASPQVRAALNAPPKKLRHFGQHVSPAQPKMKRPRGLFRR